MEKFKFEGTGNEVKMGKEYLCTIHDTLCDITYPVIMNEENIPYFVKTGVIKKVDDGNIPTSLSFYIRHLANREEWNEEDLEEFLDALLSLYPSALFSVLVKEISIVMNERHSTPLEESKELFIISTLNGKITRVTDLNSVKTFANFAFFRTETEAIIAAKILEDILYIMYN
jgi:hypothetical protein